MQPVQKISASLKCMLLAFFLWGCAQNEKILPEKVSYLTAKMGDEMEEVTEFSGIMVAERRASNFGKGSLAVKLESDNGKTIEFIIFNYQDNLIYKLEEAKFKDHWEFHSQGAASGSLRYVSGRFFLNKEKNGAVNLQLTNRSAF